HSTDHLRIGITRPGSGAGPRADGAEPASGLILLQEGGARESRAGALMPTTKTKTRARPRKPAPPKPVVWNLRLYVAGQTPKSSRAFANESGSSGTDSRHIGAAIHFELSAPLAAVREAGRAQDVLASRHPRE